MEAFEGEMNYFSKIPFYVFITKPLPLPITIPITIIINFDVDNRI